MKKLCYLVVFLAGCSSTGQYPSYFAGDMDTDTDSETNSETDTLPVVDAGQDSGTDSGSDTDSDADSGTDAGTGLPCDAGACCVGGEVSVSGTPCVIDVIPENASEDFDPATWGPFQVRCPEPDVCGSGEERRPGQVVCNGIDPSCYLDNIEWGEWAVVAESTSPETMCNPITTNGALIWGHADDPGLHQSRFWCLTYGCADGVCLPGPPIGTTEGCGDYGECGEYCLLDWFSDLNCAGICGNSCFDHGGDECWYGGEFGPICGCGFGNPACAEGFHCIYDYIAADHACIPE